MFTCCNMLRNDLFLKRMVSDSPAMLKNQDLSTIATPLTAPRHARSPPQSLEFSSALSESAKPYTMKRATRQICYMKGQASAWITN